MKATPAAGGPGLAIWVDAPSSPFGVFTPWVGAIMNWAGVQAAFGAPDVTIADYTTGETVPVLVAYPPPPPN